MNKTLCIICFIVGLVLGLLTDFCFFNKKNQTKIQTKIIRDTTKTVITQCKPVPYFVIRDTGRIDTILRTISKKDTIFTSLLDTKIYRFKDFSKDSSVVIEEENKISGNELLYRNLSIQNLRATTINNVIEGKKRRIDAGFFYSKKPYVFGSLSTKNASYSINYDLQNRSIGFGIAFHLLSF